MKQSVLLPWLEGLDRNTGAPSSNPSGFGDIRNVVYQNAAVRLRAGLGTAVASLAEPVVCYGTPFLAYGTIVWVIYDPVSRAVEVVETDLQGQNEAVVGTWGTLNSSATSPPRFIAAESFGVLVFAHDDPNVTVRLPNYRFDPADMTPWAVVQADLDGLGAEDVVARGVVQHLGYIWYWGFGSDSDPDRPEILRRSTPDDPTTLLPEAYIEFGARLSPIVGAVSGNNALLVFKSSSWFRLDGSVSADFSPVLVDPAIGLVSPRALVNLQGVVYWWSPYGPRSTNGTATQNLSFPLDLTGNNPPTLPAPGPGSYCFAFFDPDSSSMGWCFPDPEAGTSTPVFKACVRADLGIKWSYDVFAGVLMCAVLGSTGEGSFLIDPGYADPVSVTGSVGSGDASATVTWTNVDCVGDETVEIWGSVNSAAYVLLASVPVDTSAPQVEAITGAPLASGTIDIAIRHRRLGRYLTGYEDAADPSLWPVVSQASGTIIAVATPTAVTAVYDFTDGSVDVAWTNGDPTQDIEVQLFRSGTGAATSALVPLAPASVAHTFAYAVSSVQDLCRVSGMQPTAIRSGTNFLQARVRHLVSGVPGAWAASAAVVIAYDAVPGGAAVARDTALDRTSVALGTGTGLDITLPASMAGDVRVEIWVTASTYGAIPSNGGCGVTTDFGGGLIGYPNSAAVAWFDQTYPNTTPSPIATGLVAAVACATCNLIGQEVGLGLGSGVVSWQKVGDVAAHGFAFSVSLPGNSGGLFTCTV